MRDLLYVGIGGFFGAACRYLVSVWARGWTAQFPFGTLTVNVLGSLALGFGAAFLTKEPLRLCAAVGFLGSFTTFSAFSYESMLLWENGRWAAFLLNAALNVVACLGAAGLGMYASRALTS